MFANSLRIQKAYAVEKSDLFFDYTSVIQRMWIGSFTGCRLPDSELKQDLSVLVPVLLASPALAVDCSSLRLVVQSVENAWKSRAGSTVDHGPSSFPGKTQSLTITVRGHDAQAQIFRSIDTRKGTVFLSSIPHLTYLVDLEPDSRIFCEISGGLKSPRFAMRWWMDDIPWARMKSLETFSVVYPHLAEAPDIYSYMYSTRGVDMHVERLTVSAPLFKQDPEYFPWVIAPFPKTHPGEKSIRSKGISFKVTHAQGHFWRTGYKWDKVWVCGLTDG
ncbi:hypothetical protein BDR03DRAFT_968227 [Suillus americanus]|nr:hypothetical protein BDR03DRAFT_968227 [Suillus americanus]